MSQQEFAQPSGQASRRWLAVIVAAFLVVGLIYSVVVPLFEAPDEVWHFAFADHLAKGGGLPVLSGTKPVFLREGGQPPLYYTVVALAIAPFDRNDFPGWVRFNSSHPAITPGATSDTPNVFVHTAREDTWTGSVLAVHVARVVSLLFGALTVVGVYFAGRIVTGREDLALLGAAFIAFTPQFVFISASVNNDSLAAATATWVGVAALQISDVKLQISKRYSVGTGVILGLGLLSKLGGLVLIFIVGLALLIRWFRLRSLLKSETPALPKGPGRPGSRGSEPEVPRSRDSAGASVWHLTFGVLGAAALVSGWWFIRNIALYGDPLGWSVWLSDIGVRTPTPALWQLVPELPALFRTYWADFNGLQFDAGFYNALALMCLIAFVGVIKFHISSLRSQSNRKSQVVDMTSDIWHLIFLLVWLGIVLAGVLRYMQTTPAAQGRLLFLALAPIGVLLALGLAAWSERVWPVMGVAVVLFAQTLTSPFLVIRPAYAKPLVAQLPADAQVVGARFGDLVELIGVQLSADHVAPGGTLRVTTYWRALQDITRDQRLLIRLMRPDGNSAGQLDATLGTNLYPTTLWRSGQIIVDAHDVRADADLPVPLVLRVHFGVGDATEPLLPVTGPQAWSSGDVAQVGQVQVRR
jgi:hypothetical protein